MGPESEEVYREIVTSGPRKLTAGIHFGSMRLADRSG